MKIYARKLKVARMCILTKISSFILILIFYSSEGQVLFEDSDNCSSGESCKCELQKHETAKSYRRAICSHQHLTDFPYFNETVRWIDLAYNNISGLEHIERLPVHLLSLNLSNNPISSITNEQFRKFYNLDELILQNLPLDLSIVPLGLFKGLGKLTILDVKGLKMTSGEYPTNLLVSLPILNDLRINGQQKPFRSKMRKLVHLRALDLAGTTGDCNINTLHPMYFKNILNITHLDVSNCSLKEIHRTSISKFLFLRFLDISYNEEMTFSVLHNLTLDLKYTKIETLKLDKIHCTFGVGTELVKDDITNLRNTSLRYVSLNSNRLELIQKGVFEIMPSTLQHISVVDNKFTMGSYLFEVAFLSNVVTINASSLAQTHDPRFRKNCHESTNRRCTFSPKDSLDHYSNANDFLYSLHKSNTVTERSSLIDCILLPRTTQNISIAQANLRYPIPFLTFCPNIVRVVQLQGNILNRWIGPVKNVDNVTFLDLSNNVCTEVSTNFFKYFISLEYLDVRQNLIGDSLKKDISGSTFNELKRLKYLDLSFNRISILSPYILKSNVNLMQLKLQENLIEDFNIELRHLSALLLLDLSGNQLQTLNLDIRSSLSDIRKRSHLKINITNNPLRCNCEDVDFWRWVSNMDFISDPQKVTCKVGKLKPSFENSPYLADTVRKMEKLCASYEGLVAGVSCVVGLLVALIICGIVYRYRWKLRYLFYMTKSKYLGYAEVGTDHRERIYFYDCFISYANEDRGFALHNMMKNLENTTGFRMCFHQRDFVPGNDIAQNITNAIHHSRKTVCVLSPNYLNSYWCMYEFNMAKMESIYSRNGENILILVFYKHVSPEDIPLNLMSIIEQKSYIEYPDDEQGNIVFWNKLKEVIEQ